MKTHRLNKPIFIIGTGRCGSTIFHRMMAEHPHVAWQYVSVHYSAEEQATRHIAMYGTAIAGGK